MLRQRREAFFRVTRLTTHPRSMCAQKLRKPVFSRGELERALRLIGGDFRITSRKRR